MKKTLKAILAVFLAIALNFGLIGMASAEILEFVGSIDFSNNQADGLTYSAWTGTAQNGSDHFVADTSTKTCRIYSANGWAYFVNNASTYGSYTVYLECNIDFGSKDNAGMFEADFSGTFYGQGNTLKSFKGIKQENDIALFRWTTGNAKFYDLNLDNSYVQATGTSKKKRLTTGALAGYVKDGTLYISKVNVTKNNGVSEGASYQGKNGGLVGAGSNTSTITFIDCISYANIGRVDRQDNDAGFLGYTEGSVSFENCIYRGELDSSLSSYTNIGGFVGNCSGNVTIKNCSNEGIVRGGKNTGGFVGYCGGTLTIENCTNTGSVYANSAYAGGFVGNPCGKSIIKNCQGIKNIFVESNSTDVGGLIGCSQGDVEITNVTIDGATLKANGTNLGGLIGFSNGGSKILLEKITLKGNISLTNTGNKLTGNLIGETNNSGTALEVYDIDMKNAVFTRTVGTNNNQGYIIAHATGTVTVNTKSMAYNEFPAINIPTGGQYIGGLVGQASNTTSIKKVRINGNITTNGNNGSTGYYADVGGLVGNVSGTLTVDNIIITGSFSAKGKDAIGAVVGYASAAANVSNVSIDGGITIYGTGANVGGIIGNANNTSTVTNVSVGGNVSLSGGTSNHGGVIGIANGTSNINNVTVTGTVSVSGTENIGGAVGKLETSTLTIAKYNVNAGKITATGSSNGIGGLVGWAKGSVDIRGFDIASVTVSGSEKSGGIIGYCAGCTIKDSSIGTASVSSTGASMGGFVGISEGETTITSCHLDGGSVSGKQNVGGIIGHFTKSGQALTVEKCYNKAEIKSNRTDTGNVDGFVGGIVGVVSYRGSALIKDCYNAGKISAYQVGAIVRYFGGIVGGVDGNDKGNLVSISQCYNVGEVTGNADCGGIVGATRGNAVIDSCYNTGAVTANSTSIGGNTNYEAAGGISALSANNATISHCFNRGTVKANTSTAYYVGGIVGLNYDSGSSVQYCYNTGTIYNGSNSTYGRGGIVGKLNQGTASYGYSTNSGLAGIGSVSNGKTVTEDNLKGSNYLSNTSLGDIYFMVDSANKNGGFPILAWMATPFEKNAEGVWEISTPAHFATFATMVNNGTKFSGETVRVLNDINLSGLSSQVPVGGNGSTINKFMGTFDGNGHTLSNYTISNGNKYTGFFGYIEGATIKNLTLSNVKVTCTASSPSYAAVLVGYNDGTCKIEGVTLNGCSVDSTDRDDVGGFVGHSEGNITFKNIAVTNGIIVKGRNSVGGVVGWMRNNFVSDSFTATGTIKVTGKQFVGGMLGYATGVATISTKVAVNTIDIDSTDAYAGGLIGIADGTGVTTITSVTATGEINVANAGDSAGGLVGRADGNFVLNGTSNINKIIVADSSSYYAGGIIGNRTDHTGNVSINNLTVGSVTVTCPGNYVAGFVAYSKGTVTVNNVKATNVTVGSTSTYVNETSGGLVGYCKGATVSGANLGNVKIYAQGNNVGGFIANCDAANATFNGSNSITGLSINIKTNSYIGGIVGGTGGTLTAKGTVSLPKTISIVGTGTSKHGDNTRVGALVGYAAGINLSGFNFDKITLGSTASLIREQSGGFAGQIEGSATVTDCTIGELVFNGGTYRKDGGLNSHSDATAQNGGLVGKINADAVFSNVKVNKLTFTSRGKYAGGLVGLINGTAKFTDVAVYNTASTVINEFYSCGGFVGGIGGESEFIRCENNASLSHPSNSASNDNYGRFGGLVGYANSNITVTDCTNRGNVTGGVDKMNDYGGFVGLANAKATFKNCNNYGNIKSEQGSSGGFAGCVCGDSSFTNSKNYGNVSNVDGYCGGLVGAANSGTSTVSNCANYGAVSSLSNYVGGVFGRSNNTIVTSTFNTGVIKGNDGVGGIIGRLETGASTFTSCYNKGKILANTTNVGSGGGIIGVNDGSGATLNQCYNGKDATVADAATVFVNAGGLIGYSKNNHNLTDCYNTANVYCSASGAVGGLVGCSDTTNATLKYCYNTGKLSGNNSTNSGSLVGRSTPSTITRCYYLDSSVSSIGSALKQGVALSQKVMSGRAMVSLNGQLLGDGKWVIDTSNANNGYPVYGTSVAYNYFVNYDNLFDFIAWRNSTSNRLNASENNSLIVSENDNSITVVTSAASSTNDVFTLYDPDGYAIPVKPNTSYTISFDLTTTGEAQFYVFNVDPSKKFISKDTRGGTEEYSNTYAVLSYAYLNSNGKITKTFTTTDMTAYIFVRFGNSKAGDMSSTFKNIRIAETNSGITYSSTLKSCKFSDATIGTLITPVRPGYTFEGWYDGDSNKITSATAAPYDSINLYSNWSVNKHTIKWVTDGDALTGNYTKGLVEYGTKIVAPNTPTKTGYTFVGWSPSVAATMPDADVTYTAQFTKNVYTVKWVVDGVTIEEQIEHGKTPVYSGPAPTKPATAEYTYTFDGWTPTVSPATGNVTYTAQFKATKNSYTIEWIVNGTTVKSETVEYGVMPVFGGDTPTKPDTVKYTYTFDCWNPTVTTVKGNQKYVANFTETVKQYTIEWRNSDGSLIKSDKLDYGTIPSYIGDTPVKAGNAQYSYTFKGWSPEIAEVTGNATYTAQYDRTVNTYTVKWVDYNGRTILEIDENVPYGTMPTFDKPDPTKAADAQYFYTFKGWSPAVSVVKGDVTYTAGYTPVLRKYKVTFKNYDGSELLSKEFSYGVTPSYSGTPTRAYDNYNHYDFKGWDKKIVAVTESAEYTAQFTTVKHAFTYINNGEDHSCECACGYSIGNEKHELGADNKCIKCGSLMANYDELEETIKNVPKRHYFTEETYIEVDKALEAVDMSLVESKQNLVDKMNENLVKAVDNLIPILYNVTVENGTKNIQPFNKAKSRFYWIATVSAPKTNSDGQEFSYWVTCDENGEKIISTYRNYSFFVTGDTKVKAVYGADKSDALYSSRVTAVRNDGDGEYSILAEHSVSATKTLFGHGVLVTSDSSLANDDNMYVGNDEIENMSAIMSASTRTGLLEIPFEAAGKTVVYVRTYIYDENNIVKYGEIQRFELGSGIVSDSLSFGDIAVENVCEQGEQESEPVSEPSKEENKTSWIDVIKTIIEKIVEIIGKIYSLIFVKEVA